MNRLIAIAILAGTLSACAHPRNLTITEENQDSFMEELKDATLTVEEFGLITTAQMRRALATSFEAEGPVFIGKTVGDIIEEERAFLAAADARVAELRQALTLTIFDKGLRRYGKLRQHRGCPPCNAGSRGNGCATITGRAEPVDNMWNPVDNSRRLVNQRIIPRRQKGTRPAYEAIHLVCVVAGAENSLLSVLIVPVVSPFDCGDPTCAPGRTPPGPPSCVPLADFVGSGTLKNPKCPIKIENGRRLFSAIGSGGIGSASGPSILRL